MCGLAGYMGYRRAFSVLWEDEEIAVISRDKPLRVLDFGNVECSYGEKTVAMNLEQLEKKGYPHSMMKERFEQLTHITDCMCGRINLEGKNVVLSAVIDYKTQLLATRHIIIVACGTTWHTALPGKQLVESLSRISVEVKYASEFCYHNPVIGSGDVVIAISQNGEIADTLAAVNLAKSRGALIYGIRNAIGSSISRTTTGSYIHVDSEIRIASITSRVTVLIVLALTLVIRRERKTIEVENNERLVHEFLSISQKTVEVLKLNEQIARLSCIFTYARDYIYLGCRYSYPVALVEPLKLKEISYMYVEGYPAAEIKHGPMALIDTEMPVIVIATRNTLYKKILNNIQEIKAGKGKVIAIVTQGDTVISKIADICIELPETMEYIDPLLATLPLQLMAYHIAICKGMNVD